VIIGIWYKITQSYVVRNYGMNKLRGISYGMSIGNSTKSYGVKGMGKSNGGEYRMAGMELEVQF
jgi:hypothetical protein